MDNIMNYIKSTFIHSGETYRYGGVNISINQCEADNSFECTTPLDRPALYVTGHQTWSHCDKNMTYRSGANDRGKLIAKQEYHKATGKRATFCEPVYVYQHGGAKYERSPSCKWDSGFLGWFCFHKGDYRKAYKGKTPSYDGIMDTMLRLWSDELNNECYEVRVTNDASDFIMTSEPFNGSDWSRSGLYDWLATESSTCVRIHADDVSLTYRGVTRDLGRRAVRALALQPTLVGNKLGLELGTEDKASGLIQ
jgi:hypothetical protein